MLYKDWLSEWLIHYVQPSVKQKTFQRYSEMIRNHIDPTIGEYEMSEMSPLLVQRLVTDLLQSGNIRTGKGLSANSVNAIITTIQSSFECAYNLGLIEKYEMNKIKRPKAQEKQIECFSPAEQKKIEAAILSDKRDKMFGVLICLYTGLRIGELLALEWNDIDLGKGELNVSKTCHDAKDSSGNYERVVNAPKSLSSSRIIPIPKQIIPLLRERKKKSHSPYVVASGQDIISVRSYQRSFELLLNKLEISHRGFHALRHTFATRALECGMDVKTLSEILGHKNPTVTLNRYAHSLMDHKKAMMNRLGSICFKS
jgi:integrase